MTSTAEVIVVVVLALLCLWLGRITASDTKERPGPRYNPPPKGIKRPEKPTPAPPRPLYDKLGRWIKYEREE